MHKANRLAGTGGHYKVRQWWKGRTGRRKAHKYIQGPGKTINRRTQGHAERSEPSMHKQIFTSSPVRPEAAQPAADSPPPHTWVPMPSSCFQGASGAVRVPLVLCHPWCVLQRGRTCGGCAASPEGCQGWHRLLPCREGTGTSLGLRAGLQRSARWWEATLPHCATHTGAAEVIGAFLCLEKGWMARKTLLWIKQETPSPASTQAVPPAHHSLQVLCGASALQPGNGGVLKQASVVHSCNPEWLSHLPLICTPAELLRSAPESSSAQGTQLLKMDTLCRGQLATWEVGGGQGSAFSKRSGQTLLCQEYMQRKGWAPSASHPLGG